MSHAVVLVISKTPEDVERLLAPFDENLEVEEYTEDGETWWRNPQAKWDWWQVGGRWSGELITEDGPCDQARKRDLDFEAMGLRNAERAGGWWDDVHLNNGFALSRDIHEMTREEYVRSKCAFSFLAVVTPDGEWREQGRLVWFGQVADEKDQREWDVEFAEIIRNADPDAWVTIVDYHI